MTSQYLSQWVPGRECYLNVILILKGMYIHVHDVFQKIDKGGQPHIREILGGGGKAKCFKGANESLVL